MRRLCAFLLVLVVLGGVMAPVSFVPNTTAPTHLGDFRQTAQQAGTASRLQSGQGAHFLTDVLTDARLVVLIRFAGWQDVSTDVLHEQPITITPGRANESSVAPPARATLTLKNPDRRYSQFDPLGPNWPYVRENALLWIKLYVDGQYYTRFYGEIKGFKQGHDITGNYSVVNITAADLTQRVGLPRAPLKSPLYRAIMAAGPRLYWPIEDEANATQAASAVAGGPPLTAQGTVRFNAVNPLTAGQSSGVTLTPGTTFGFANMPQLKDGGALSTRFGAGSATAWSIQAVAFNGRDAADTALAKIWVVMQWTTSDGAIWRLLADPVTTNTTYVTYNGATVVSVAGTWLFDELRVDAQQSGANISVTLTRSDTITSTGTTAATLSGVVGISLSPDQQTFTGDWSVSQVRVWDGVSEPNFKTADLVSAFWGYPGETPRARMARICAEEGIPFATVGDYSSSVTMGQQGTDSLMSTLRECELTDAGFLYGGQGDGLQFQGISARYNQASAVAFDASAGEVVPPFEPLPDDYGRVNKITVSRKNGSSANAEDVDGPLGTAAIGTSESALPQPVNYASDTRLSSRATWEVHRGSGKPGFRYPAVSLNLRKTPTKIPGWLAVTPGGAITVNPPYLANNPSEAIRLVVEGWTETLSSLRWEVTANCARQDVYDAFEVGHTRLGRVEARGSTLAADAAAGATSLSVAKTVGLPWTTTATRPADFPFDVEISGIQVTVTAIVGATSPQTFTVTGVTKNLRAGDAVKLWRPGVIAL